MPMFMPMPIPIGGCPMPMPIPMLMPIGGAPKGGKLGPGA